MGIFKVHEKFTIRHNILKYLFNKIEIHKLLTVKLELNNSNVPFEEVVNSLNIPYKKVYNYHHAIHYGSSNQLKCFMNKDIHYIGLEEAGVAAYVDEYWLKEGRTDLNERTYDKSNGMIPVIALIITAISLIFSAFSVQQTRRKVELMQSEIENFKTQLRPSSNSTLLPHK